MTVSDDTKEHVILVDENDRQVGTGGKIHVHEVGLLHRAFSIFVFDMHGRTLIQKRAREKYHSGGLWANTCCGHPRPGEAIDDAAKRRLNEELGFETELSFGFTSRYRADLDRGMIENELVHVFAGISAELPIPEPTEVCEIAYVSFEQLRNNFAYAGSDQTVWLRHYLDNHYAQLLDMRRRCNSDTFSKLSASSYAFGREEALGRQRLEAK